MKWISPARLQNLGIQGMNRRNLDFIGRYNERRLYPLVDDKLKTKILANQYAVPVAQLHFVVRHQHEVRHIEGRLEGLQGFAVKPAKGSGGKGILIVSERSGDTFVKPSGNCLGLDDLRRHLSNILAGLYSLSGVPDVAIVEDLIELDDCFQGYSHEGIPDLRVIVFRGYPVMAMLRLATHASDGKANLHQGAVGVGLDIATGRCLNAVQFHRPVQVHPDTGQKLKDIHVPDWPSILVLAARCYEMTGLGYMGTDIVIDRSRGPLLLELNARPGLAIQIANNQGILPRLEHIESLAGLRPEPEARVRYAMETFSG
ncbi:alpha-L-glutamate ligase-like protein [Geoalkalibacter halelectricus]|uniref:Alpha-L-glutamate ligase-like protein n=1 Tax=Geoalkalibacter halelectricus TaxID=2847045 RepID=A0ABY5ZMN5_9BACT|nr:alpha-L-glutamate ligase-like protein [Geoalkalibacter halelectricus]MDO3378562.1 alpha-L-glutamate ligase-like protein [Geoalkalibacter halelectricus]UWZ80124.1 alpha-L-glutamate ligase-like protein [Geoalkalibacter halelectricus]